MKAIVDRLPPKVIIIAGGVASEEVALPTSSKPGGHVKAAYSRLQAAKFTGKGDRESVQNLYTSYVERIASSLQKTLAFAGEVVAHKVTIEPLPNVSVREPSFQLLQGHYLLLRLKATAGGKIPSATSERKVRLAVHAVTAHCYRLAEYYLLPSLLPTTQVRLGKVLVSCREVEQPISGGQATRLSYENCSHAVLPWWPPKEGWSKNVQYELQTLQSMPQGERS